MIRPTRLRSSSPALPDQEGMRASGRFRRRQLSSHMARPIQHTAQKQTAATLIARPDTSVGARGMASTSCLLSRFDMVMCWPLLNAACTHAGRYDRIGSEVLRALPILSRSEVSRKHD